MIRIRKYAISDPIRFFLAKLYLRLRYDIYPGRRLIIVVAGSDISAKDSKASIGQVSDLFFCRVNHDTWDVSVYVNMWGYDIPKHHFEEGVYCKASCSTNEIIQIVRAQAFLKARYRNIDLSKDPEYFYGPKSRLILPYGIVSADGMDNVILN